MMFGKFTVFAAPNRYIHFCTNRADALKQSIQKPSIILKVMSRFFIKISQFKIVDSC